MRTWEKETEKEKDANEDGGDDDDDDGVSFYQERRDVKEIKALKPFCK